MGTGLAVGPPVLQERGQPEDVLHPVLLLVEAEKAVLAPVRQEGVVVTPVPGRQPGDAPHTPEVVVTKDFVYLGARDSQFAEGAAVWPQGLSLLMAMPGEGTVTASNFHGATLPGSCRTKSRRA